MFDMAQADAAVELLESMPDGDSALTAAVETAIVVCYAPGFTESHLYRLGNRHRLEGQRFRQLHRELLDRRRHAYAHTDRPELSGHDHRLRIEDVEAAGEPGYVSAVLERDNLWRPIPREILAELRALFARQRARFDATSIEIAIRIGRERHCPSGA